MSERVALDAIAVVGMERALAHLAPMEPPAIATSLLTSGARGKRHHCGRCPLAVYLRKWTGRDVLVYADHVSMWAEGGWRTFTLPESVAAFVAYFDGGQFRELRA